MEHFFSLPVLYKGAEEEYQARLVTFGYSYKFYVMVDKTELVVEKDDERNYRIISEQQDTVIDSDLCVAIIESLKQIEH